MIREQKTMAVEKCEEHTGCVNGIKRNTEDIQKIYELVEKIRNRLPNWATLLISVLALVIGWLIRKVT